jgi:hypothetical protein
MAKHRKRGSSKAGRPRKDGDRYPSGKLKPRGPNETTLAKRRAGDASAGEHPLDFALSKGWLTERQHKDAMAYRATYNLAHAGRFGPRLAQGDLAEVEPSEALRESWSSLSDAQIASVFDTVFNVTPPTAEREQKEAAARLRWKLINASLSSAQRQEVFMVAVLGSWPFWMVRAGSSRPAHCLRYCEAPNAHRRPDRHRSSASPEQGAQRRDHPARRAAQGEGRAQRGVSDLRHAHGRVGGGGIGARCTV